MEIREETSKKYQERIDKLAASLGLPEGLTDIEIVGLLIQREEAELLSGLPGTAATDYPSHLL